jgi:hypothetical protein
MKLSELIVELQELLYEKGDYDVYQVDIKDGSLSDIIIYLRDDLMNEYRYYYNDNSVSQRRYMKKFKH